MNVGDVRKIAVAMTGATGAILGVRLLEVLREIGVETHLIMSSWGTRMLLHETPYTLEQIKGLASFNYDDADQASVVSSGSYLMDGMVIMPCSMRALSAIAHGLSDTLIHRAADVTIKERRKLVLVPREAPLSEIHLENMLKLSRMGVVIFPPVPAFYNQPREIKDLVDHMVMRVLDQLNIHLDISNRWGGPALDSV